MDESDKHDDFEIRELSLIDVSFEDDCLISSPITSPLHHPFSENQERKSVKFSVPFDASNEETMFNSTEENKDECQSPGSTEPEKTKTSGKYNLRKSLAWDNAFFTSEGVLEPEELCSMMGAVEKSERQVLPGIQEDTKKSTDSLSTLESDNLTSKSLEGDLFEDIRASIQKSNNFSNVMNSNSKKKPGISQSQNIQSKKADLASQDKMKPKAIPKKPSAGSQGSGKLTKQVAVRPQTSQSVSTKRESALPLRKPPKVQNRVSSISTEPTKRASLSASHVNMEINSAKNAPGRMVLVPKVVPSCGGSRNPVPKPTLPTRIPLRSSAAIRKELTTSCSSFESSSSTSSDSVGTLSLNMKRKNNSGTKNSPSSGATAKSLSRVAPKSKSQSGGSKLSSYLRSTNNLSSKVSPASSTSEWSSKSSSPSSTANQRHKGTRASSDPLTEVSAKIDISQNFHLQSQSNECCSSGDDAKVPGLVGECVKGTSTSGTSAPLRAASMKPSGLRLPSPKIGFFDGAKSAMRTPNANVTSHPGVSCASPKIGTGSSSSNGGLDKAKLGKFPPSRKPMASRGAKPDSQPTSLSVKPKSPLPLQERLNAAASIISKSAKSPIISPKVQSRMSAVIGGESCMKVEETRKEHEKSAPDFDLSEKDDGQGGLKGKSSPEPNRKTEVTNFISSPKNLNASIYSNSISDAENVNPSQIACEDANLIRKTNEMEQDLFDDQVDNLVGKLGAMKINVEAENTFSSLKDCVLTESN